MKQLTILLPEKIIKEAKEIAEKEQIPYTVLFRNWIVQRVRQYAPVSPAKMPH